MKPAVFLDRDGTIIRDVHYIGKAADVELLPDSARAIRDLQAAGFACVVISNQSAVGRGVITHEDVRLVQVEVDRQLAQAGVRLDGFYYCPHAPSVKDRTTIEHPDRKPGPGMLLRAAQELALDLARSWMVGDMPSDVLAGRNAGCIGGILVRTGHGAKADAAALALADHVADHLGDAARYILAHRSPPASGHAPTNRTTREETKA